MNNLSIISNLLIIINSSVNFFVYLNKDPKFLLCFYHCISSSVENSCAEICRPVPDTETQILRWIHIITKLSLNLNLLSYIRRNCSRHCQYSLSERSKGMSNITHKSTSTTNNTSTVSHISNKGSGDSARAQTEELSLLQLPTIKCDILNDSESAKMTKKTVKVTDL